MKATEKEKLLEAIKAIKWPRGKFSHTDLAELNGVSNQKVWKQWDGARKIGHIVRCGDEPNATGKGKRRGLCILATQAGTIKDLDTKSGGGAKPKAKGNKPKAQPKPVEAKADTKDKGQPKGQPNKKGQPKGQPVVGSTVEVAKVGGQPKGQPKGQPTGPVAVTLIRGMAPPPKDSKQIKETCPCCHHPLFSVADATGIMVWCAQGEKICSSAEAPFGHGKTEKEALEVLNDKWSSSNKEATAKA